MTTAGPRDQGKKDLLIRIGIAALTEKGFHNTPIDELVAAAGVPKGSFTYYFGSKDAYALAVIEGFARYFNKKLDRILSDRSMPPLARFKAFADEAASGMERFAFRRGCLVGNLGQEVGALDDRFRIALLSVLAGWQDRIRACIEEAQQSGEVRKDADAAALAKLFWYSWEGAVLGAKLEKSRAPLDGASEAFVTLLKSLAPSRPGNGRRTAP